MFASARSTAGGSRRGPSAGAAAGSSPRQAPRVVGALSHMFEGTTRRGHPRALAALSAPAAVSPDAAQGVLHWLIICRAPLSAVCSHCNGFATGC